MLHTLAEKAEDFFNMLSSLLTVGLLEHNTFASSDPLVNTYWISLFFGQQ